VGPGELIGTIVVGVSVLRNVLIFFVATFYYFCVTSYSYSLLDSSTSSERLNLPNFSFVFGCSSSVIVSFVSSSNSCLLGPSSNF